MKRWMWVGILLLCCSGQLWAAEQTEPMDDVVVTATRTSTDLQHIGGTSLTVITAADIEARHLTSVVDVLNTVPGLQISNVGGLGAPSKVSIRGAHTKDTLLLIDGVVANDSADINGGADFSNITLDNVERIEVVRGAMSVLYGSNATAGVINIITKSGTAKTHGYVGGESGTYNTHKVYGGLNGSLGISDFSLSLSRLTSGGYSLANTDNPRIPHDGNTSEKDSWENTTFSSKVSLDLCSTTTLTAILRTVEAEMDGDDWAWSWPDTLGYAADRFDFSLVPDGLKKNKTDTHRLFGKLNLHNQLFDGKLVSDLDYKYTRQHSVMYDNDDNQNSNNLGKGSELSWQGTVQLLPSYSLTGGIGYVYRSIDSYGIYTGTTAEDSETLSCWLQNQLIVGGLDLVAGVRYDDHDRFGGKATWRIAPAYHVVATNTTLRASYATGFRTPSLTELYANRNGNQNLDPEKSKSWEVGVDQSLLDESVKVGVTYFAMQFEDRIGSGPAPDYLYVQVKGKSKASGVELFTKWQIIDTLTLTADYTYTDTEDPDGVRTARRPLNKVHAGVRYAFAPAASVNIDGYWVDERDTIYYCTDAQGNTVTSLDDYFLVNLAAQYDITDMLRIYARVDNLFDEHYEEAWSYATPGQSFYVGAKLTF